MKQFHLALLLVLFSCQLMAQAPATTAAGYYFYTAPNYSLVNMSGSTQAIGPNYENVATITFDMGFNFNFAGTNYSRFSVNSSGVMALGNTPVSPIYYEPRNQILNPYYVYPILSPWSDELRTASNGGVLYKIITLGGMKRLVIEWRVKASTDEDPANNYNKTFQVWLSEGTNRIQYVFGTSPVRDENSYIGIAKSYTDYKLVNSTTHTITQMSNNTWPGAGRSYTFSPVEIIGGALPISLDEEGTTVHVNCFGSANGAITLGTISGGDGNYTITWTGPNGFTATGSAISNLAAGTYSFTITDGSNTAPVNGSRTINQPAELGATITAMQACAGNYNGSITISNPVGGSGNYEFKINNENWQSSGSFNALGGGSYTLQMRDASATSCIKNLGTQTVTEFTLSATLVSTEACSGTNNGSITISNPTGGSGNYEYNVNNGSWQSSNTFNSLGAGTYSVQMRDIEFNSCIKILGNQVINEYALNASVSSTATCTGANNGSISISNTSGGSGNFEFSINNGTWQSSNVFSALNAGTYSVQMRDIASNSCIKNLGNQTITEYVLNATVSSTSTCAGTSNGSISISNTSGGSGNFEFSINNGTWQSSNVFSALNAGTYSVQMRDIVSNSCIKNLGDQTITEYVLNATVSSTSTCAGTSNGSISISNTSGGSGNYQFSINNGNWQGSGLFTNLSAGSYSVQMRDANTGCIKLIGNQVVAEFSLNATVSTSAACQGTNNGSISISNATGGSGNYAYRLSNGNPQDPAGWQMAAGFTGLAAGTYALQMRDANNTACIKNLGNVVIAQAPNPEISILVNAPAFCNDVILTATSINGASYSWSNGETTRSISLNNNSADGPYTVTVTNTNGCSGTASYQYAKQNILNNYTVVGLKTITIGENNTVNGSVGLTAAGQTTRIYKNSVINGFVKSPVITLQAPVTITMGSITGVATVTLPTMLFNTAVTSGLPNLVIPDDYTGPAINYNVNQLTIGRRAQVTLTGNVFGKIIIKEAADVIFTAGDISINDIAAENGKTLTGGIDYLSMSFNPNTIIRVKNTIQLGDRNRVYGTGSTFYMGDLNTDDEEISIKGKNTTVNANMYMPLGTLSITNNDLNAPCIMNGTYIAETINCEKNITWSAFDCNAETVQQFTHVEPVQTGMVGDGIFSILEQKTTDDGLNAAIPAIAVYPSPSTGNFTLQINAGDGPADIVIMNQLGVEVLREGYLNISKQREFKFDLSKYPSGLYYIKVITESKIYTKQFIKIN